MNTYIVLDTETGGLDEKKNPITEIGLQVLDTKKLTVIDTWQTYVKPYEKLFIDPKALAATQLSMEDIETGLDYRVAAKELAKVFIKHTSGSRSLKKPILIGHNTQFDIKFLEQLYKFLDKDLYEYIDKYFVCTMKQQQNIELSSRNFEKTRFTLTACCERMGVKLHSAHGAMADVEATKKLFIKQTKIARSGISNADTNEDTGSKQESKARNFFEM